MRTALYVAGLAAALAAGYFWGQESGAPGGRADQRAAVETGRTERRVIEIPADEEIVLRQAAKRARAAEAEVARLRERLRVFEPEVLPEPPVGGRREDGTIVGGATFTAQTKSMAIGFVLNRFKEFLEEANLTEHQKAVVTKGFEERIATALQISADFVNGDSTSDEAYDQLESMAVEGRALLATVLDEHQMEVFRKHEKKLVEFVHENVVANEMATLRRSLDLDREQEKNIRRVVENRYRQVQEKFQAPLPNMFFHPIRRGGDKEIYDATAEEIRGYLTPEQAAGLDAIEQDPNGSFAEYRAFLVPK